MISSDSDDEDIIDYYQYRRVRHIQTREYWVHPYIRENMSSRLFVAASELSQTDRKFIAFYRMSKESFQELKRLISPFVEKMNTTMRECVPAEERILITLRYLATGETFVSIALYFARGESTVRQIIRETTEVIWDALKDIYMPVPTRNQFKDIADRFEQLWNLPNCIGAVDGKHIRIEKFPHTGSENFNYKHFHSTVLLACCDADGLFTMIEPGFAGRNSDGGIFKTCAMNYWMTHGGFAIPSPSPLRYDESNTPFPFYFVADEAFPLGRHVFRPYSSRVLDDVKRIFNSRLSRGRKCIECVFGMAAEKFAVLNGPIRCRDPTTVNNIVKAACILHNFVRKREGIDYSPADRAEINETAEIPINIQTQPLQIHEGSSAANLRAYIWQIISFHLAHLYRGNGSMQYKPIIRNNENIKSEVTVEFK